MLGLLECLCLMNNVNAELPGSLGKKGAIACYTIHVSYIQLVIKPELLLGDQSSRVIAPRCGQLGHCSVQCPCFT